MKEKILIVKKKIKMMSQKVFITCLALLCLGNGIGPISIAYSSSEKNNDSSNIISVTDCNTTDDYINKLLNDESGSRYSGKIWSDKTVSSGNMILDEETDGYAGEIKSDKDFLHTYSALGTSQKYSGQLPNNLTIVFDNSGSMYGNAKIWEQTRIALTVESINKTIDSFMEANPLNQISVVLFGDGEKSEFVGDEVGNSTAKTIIPMGHYDYISGEGYKEYIKAGWNSNTNSGDTPDHDASSSSGCVFVDRSIIFQDSGYDKYVNGTTNIQAGIYKGMKELVDAEPKTATIGDIVVERIPALIVLTDGEATDMLQGIWSNPTVNNRLEALGFINDFNEKNTSFVGTYINNNGNYAYSWNQFIEEYTDPENEIYEWKQIARNKENYNENGEYSDGIRLNWLPNEEDVHILEELSEQNKNSKEYMLFMQLMTTAYMKAQVEKLYKQKLSVYTISVDMEDPTDPNFTAENNKITSNGAMMNPSKCFNIEWLTEKGYLVEEEDDDGTSYKKYSVGSNIVLAIKDAINDWKKWKEDKENINIPEYRPIQGATKVPTKTIYGYTGKPGHSDFFEVSSAVKLAPIEHLKQDDPEKNPYNLTDDDIDIFYVEKAYYVSTYSDLNSTVTDTFEEIIRDINQRPFAPIGEKKDLDESGSINYIDPIGEYMEIKNGDIEIDNSLNDMAMLLFGELYGIKRIAVYDETFNNNHLGNNHNEQGTEKAFIKGWYKSDGTWIGESEGDFNNGDIYYIDKETAYSLNPKLSETDDSDNAKKVYTFYGIAKSEEELNKYRWNECYGEAPSDEQEILEEYYNIKNPGVYKLSDICIWEEDKKLTSNEAGVNSETNLDYIRQLHVNIPIQSLPLQIAEIILDANGIKEYKTNLENKKIATPVRLFYKVGICNEIKDTNGKIDLSKVSKEYVENHQKDIDGKKYVYFYSNYYDKQDTNTSTLSYGNATTTFSPSMENRFYIFQKNLVIYKNSSNGEGELQQTGGNIKLSGEVTNLDEINKNDTYYLAIDYYVPGKNGNGKLVKYAVERKGEEFFGEQGEIYLTYYNKDSDSEVEEPGNNVVVATKKGEKRIGDLNKFLIEKEENVTETANYFYAPTYGKTTEDSKCRMINYLGNNGELMVADSSLFITKQVNNSKSKNSLNKLSKEEFKFTITANIETTMQEADIYEFDGENWNLKETKTLTFVDNTQDLGTKIATFTLKDGEGLLLEGLNAEMQYTVVEEITKEQREESFAFVNVQGRTDDKVEINGTKILGTTDLGIRDEVKYINNYEEKLANLTIKKEIIGDLEEKDRNWTFQIILTPKEGEILEDSYNYVGGSFIENVKPAEDGKIELTKNKDGSYTGNITLKHGQEITIQGILEGTKYKIIEVLANEDGYKTKVVNEEGILDENKEVLVENRKDKFLELAISKKVEGNDADKKRDWTFEITFEKDSEEISINNSYNYIGESFIKGVEAVEDGKIELTKNKDESYTGIITLKHGQKIRIKDIMQGVKYKVVEKEANEDGYTTKVTNGEGVLNEKQWVQFTNTRNALAEKWTLPYTGEKLILGNMAILNIIIGIISFIKYKKIL